MAQSEWIDPQHVRTAERFAVVRQAAGRRKPCKHCRGFRKRIMETATGPITIPCLACNP